MDMWTLHGYAGQLYVWDLWVQVTAKATRTAPEQLEVVANKKPKLPPTASSRSSARGMKIVAPEASPAPEASEASEASEIQV